MISSYAYFNEACPSGAVLWLSVKQGLLKVSGEVPKELPLDSLSPAPALYRHGSGPAGRQGGRGEGEGGVCISLKEDTVMGVGIVSLSRLLILLLEFGMGRCETGNRKSKH